MSTGMTIDQMIEAAAKAAGVPIRRIDDGWEVSFVDSYGEAYEPNIDNAQSFWLAAALRINVEHNHPSDNHAWVWAGIEGESEERMFQEDVPDESQRADRMRLAILRCAAAQAPAVEIDQERMEKAMASKTFTLPNGLSESEIVGHFTRAAKEQA